MEISESEEVSNMFKKLYKILIRTFLGIADLFEGEFFEKFSEWVLKETEWAIVITAVLGLGFKKNITPIIILGVLLLATFLIYNINTTTDKLFLSFNKDITQINERNKKHGLPNYSKTATLLAFFIIMVSFHLITFLALYYGIVAFGGYFA